MLEKALKDVKVLCHSCIILFLTTVIFLGIFIGLIFKSNIDTCDEAQARLAKEFKEISSMDYETAKREYKSNAVYEYFLVNPDGVIIDTYPEDKMMIGDKVDPKLLVDGSCFGYIANYHLFDDTDLKVVQKQSDGNYLICIYDTTWLLTRISNDRSTFFLATSDGTVYAPTERIKHFSFIHFINDIPKIDFLGGMNNRFIDWTAITLRPVYFFNKTIWVIDTTSILARKYYYLMWFLSLAIAGLASAINAIRIYKGGKNNVIVKLPE